MLRDAYTWSLLIRAYSVRSSVINCGCRVETITGLIAPIWGTVAPATTSGHIVNHVSKTACRFRMHQRRGSTMRSFLVALLDAPIVTGTHRAPTQGTRGDSRRCCIMLKKHDQSQLRNLYIKSPTWCSTINIHIMCSYFTGCTAVTRKPIAHAQELMSQRKIYDALSEAPKQGAGSLRNVHSEWINEEDKSLHSMCNFGVISSRLAGISAANREHT
ncbi:hypothetical protein EDB92DRAFT_289768 [Lactarius akahatsu]|uniref:Uncharacterized protein n=1 Tax=Lactarius akahatsu TaxID=416441 RepID=A0AAD4LKR2_9AGAM|nr:hypothetical protein EDB92DRAFT_289768 [Lactarius akahatsu]